MNAMYDVLRTIFGYDEFRGHQHDIVSHLIQGQDAFVLMPTGAGKSLCYQIPSLVRKGVGVVISPLIALMQDQVDALLQLGVKAGLLNSTLSANEVNKIENRVLQGDIDILYISPERLLMPRCLDLLTHTEIALFAIDEAHCVSQWGHDFRPEYMQLSILKSQFPHIPCIALTATADEPTRRDIISQLGLANAKQFVSSFDRPNIQYCVVEKNNPREQLHHFLTTEYPQEAGIVYCLSRKKVEETATWLQEKGWDALPYHAGLSNQLRLKHQQHFIREEASIIVATIAFGMGIDKSNVRFVAHLDLPKSLENYYQETGRAGRDGMPAKAWLSYGLSDLITLQQMLSNSQADEKHKRIERRKLEAVLGFCETTLCRREVLLNYFGETYQGPCGYCDNCLQPVTTWDGKIAAQMALSCIYRTGQRFGVKHLIDVLIGKVTPQVERFKHQHVSTFGIGKDYTAQQWSSIYRQLVAANLITIDISGFGSLRLTEKSLPILRGEQTIALRKETPKTKKTKNKREKGNASTPTDKLWAALKAKRLALAKDQGVPPYVIFHDSTLAEMHAKKPKTLDEFAEISGVGESKLQRYGREFIELICQQQAELNFA